MDNFGMTPVNLPAVIRTAIAPVVSASGVGLLLLRLSARLGRMVDRTRIVVALTCVVVAMFVFVCELSESFIALERSIRTPG